MSYMKLELCVCVFRIIHYDYLIASMDCYFPRMATDRAIPTRRESLFQCMATRTTLCQENDRGTNTRSEEETETDAVAFVERETGVAS